MRVVKFLLFSVIFSITLPGFAQNVVDVTYGAESKSSSKSGARKQMFKEAVKDLSHQYIQEIIGADKAKKNAELIEKKIVRDSGKYILYIKGEDWARSEKGSTMNVRVKLSLKNLKSLLLKEGLLYRLDGPPKVLPLVFAQDKVSSISYHWWAQPSSQDTHFLAEQVKVLHKELKKQLSGNGFFVATPVESKMYHRVPGPFQLQSPRTEDALLLGEYLKSSIVIRGKWYVTDVKSASDVYKIQVKLEALHSSNGRVIGEVFRQYETDSGSMALVVGAKWQEQVEGLSRDLGTQIYDAWQRGTFGANLIRLTLNGDFNFKQLDQFKKLIVSEIREVKTLRERFFAPGKVEFEIDASGSTKKLAKSFESSKFPRFKVEVDDVSADRLVLNVKNSL